MPKNKLIDNLNLRFTQLLISHKYALMQQGASNFLNFEDTEQGSSRRELLAVEAVARMKDREQMEDKQKFKEYIEIALHEKIRFLLEERLSETEEIYKEVIHIQDEVPALLDILSVKAASINRIDPLVNHLVWLKEELIKLANLPQYRRSDRAVVRLEDAGLVLRFIGLDNLKMIIPAFAKRHWLPHSTEPYTLMRRKLWEHSLATGIAAKRIAQEEDENSFFAYCLGLFCEVGATAVIRLYMKTFHEVWEKEVRFARDERMKDEHDALVDMELNPAFLCEMLLAHSNNVSMDMIQMMDLKRLYIAPAMHDLVAIPYDDRQPIAQIVSRASWYSKYKILVKHRLINNQEVKELFHYLHMSRSTLEILNKTNLKNLSLEFED